MPITQVERDKFFKASEAARFISGDKEKLELVSALTSRGNKLISGGAAWNSGLGFRISELNYVIQGRLYSSAGGTVTLNAADESNPRIDVIIADINGNLSKVTGTPAPSPAKPAIDDETEVEITFVQVNAGASTPVITALDIYLENVEWTINATAGFNANSTNSPFAGTKCVEATNVGSSDYIYFTAPAPQNITDVNLLEVQIKSKAAWPTNRNIRLGFFNGGVQNGNWVTIKSGDLGFNSSNTTSYQTLVLNKALFNLATQTVTQLRIEVKGSGGNVGFFLDNIRLQAGVPSNVLQNVFSNIQADTGETRADSPADILKIAGANGIETSITQDTVTVNLKRLTTNRQNLSGTKTLLNTDVYYQFLNPNGANRDVVLPNPATTNSQFHIKSLSASYDLRIKESAGGDPVATIGTTGNLIAICVYDGTEWQILVL